MTDYSNMPNVKPFQFSVDGEMERLRVEMTAIPKHIALLPRSANTMLRDCRQILARQLRLKRKVERAGATFEVETLKSPFVAYTSGEKR